MPARARLVDDGSVPDGPHRRERDAPDSSRLACETGGRIHGGRGGLLLPVEVVVEVGEDAVGVVLLRGDPDVHHPAQVARETAALGGARFPRLALAGAGEADEAEADVRVPEVEVADEALGLDIGLDAVDAWDEEEPD